MLALPPPLPLQAPALKNMVTVPKRMLPRLELIKFLAGAPALGGRSRGLATAAGATSSPAPATAATFSTKPAAAAAPVPATPAAFVDGLSEGSRAGVAQRPQYPATLPLPRHSR